MEEIHWLVSYLSLCLDVELFTSCWGLCLLLYSCKTWHRITPSSSCRMTKPSTELYCLQLTTLLHWVTPGVLSVMDKTPTVKIWVKLCVLVFMFFRERIYAWASCASHQTSLRLSDQLTNLTLRDSTRASRRRAFFWQLLLFSSSSSLRNVSPCWIWPSSRRALVKPVLSSETMHCNWTESITQRNSTFTARSWQH